MDVLRAVDWGWAEGLTMFFFLFCVIAGLFPASVVGENVQTGSTSVVHGRLSLHRFGHSFYSVGRHRQEYRYSP